MQFLKQIQIMGGETSQTQKNLLLKIISNVNQSQELFDYQQQKNEIQLMNQIHNPIYIVQDQLEINFKHQSEYQQLQDHLVFKIQYQNHQIIFDSFAQHTYDLWRVIQEGQSHPIEIGTEVKIGKVKLILKEIVENNNQLDKTLKQENDHDHMASSFCKSDVTNEDQCRICFGKSNTVKDPLVCLCRCAGTLKYTHFQCLKDWFSKKYVILKNQNNSIFYSYIEPKCEICKKQIEREFYINQRKFSLIGIDRYPEAPYAIFEYLENDKENQKTSVWLIGLNTKEEITVGRNNNCHVTMKQISVSRHHCSLLYKDKQIFIKDKKSKFGTLIKVDESLQFNINEGLQLQFGSKLISLYTQNLCGNCCCGGINQMTLRLNRAQNIKEIQSEIIAEENNLRESRY